MKATRRAWRLHRVLLSTTGKERGSVRGESDGRMMLDAKQKAELGLFIGKEHGEGRQVFCRTVRDWLKAEFNLTMSNRAVGKLLFRLNYRRRRGRIKVPPFNEERLARIRRFLVEIDRAVKEENEGNAVLVYMDESFVHQAHGSAYSYFFMDQEGVVDDGFGRTSGKGLRLIMVHAITKHGPLVTRCDAESSDGGIEPTGFPVEEGWFKGKEKGRGIQGKENFTHAEVETSEFLWQAKLAKGDYHAAMTDEMFMTWLEKRLTPAFRKVFGDKKMILILDNASYHHGYDCEVKVPETNSKKFNTELLRKHGCSHITVKRNVADGRGGQKEVNANVEVPPIGQEFPQKNSKCGNGVSREQVAQGTRKYFEQTDPTKLQERVETFMQSKGWELIWTPPYMPSFQPIELFWQHGKHYVSMMYKGKRNMKDVHSQMRKGWYGDPTWDGQEGGWKPADCSQLVRHAIDQMNDWVSKRDAVLSGVIGALVVPLEYDEDDGPADGNVDDEGVGAELGNDDSWEADFEVTGAVQRLSNE